MLSLQLYFVSGLSLTVTLSHKQVCSLDSHLNLPSNLLNVTDIELNFVLIVCDVMFPAVDITGQLS